MSTAIERHLLPLGFRMPQPHRDVIGGYFVWLGLPSGMNAAELTQLCQDEENLIIAPGGIFEVPGDDSVTFAGSIRLCFAAEDEPKLSEGVRRIGEVAKRLLTRHENADGEFVVVERGQDQDKLQQFM